MAKEDLYLDNGAVKRLSHYAHPIPATRGISQAFVAETYPGWNWNDLIPVLLAQGLYDKDTRSLIAGVDGVWMRADGTVEPERA